MATKSTASETVGNGMLPKGWRIVKFGDVVRDVKESERDPLGAGLERYIGLEHIEPENLHIKEWGDLTKADVSFTKRFRRGQVLFGKRRAYLRKVALAEFDGICSSDILTLEPKKNDLIAELLPFIVQSDAFFNHALGTSSGSLSPRTRWSQLRNFEFLLPSLMEQRRIAETLRCATDVVQRYQKAIPVFEETFQAVLRDLFTCGVRSSSTTTTGTVTHPVTWNVGTLEDIAEFVTSGSRGWAKYYSDDGPLFLRSQNVRNQVLDFTDRQHVRPPDGTEGERTKVRAGDVLITITGNSVGNVAFVPAMLTQAYVSQHVGLIRLNNPELHRFVCAFLSPSGPGNHQIMISQYGQSKPGLSLVGIRKFLIPIPPEEELRQIDCIIQRFHDAREQIEGHLGKAHATLASLTNSLLSNTGTADDIQ